MKRGLILFVLALFGQTSSAYVEYAVRYNIIRCTACHLSPVGGGPKTINGKLFGAHGYELNPRLVQDFVGGDFRALFDYPQAPSRSRGGAGVMSGAVSGHVALDRMEHIHLVIEQNIAGFSKAPLRDTYALFRFGAEDGQPRLYDSLMVGRFRIPFGIITDEHRTFTRLQSATEWFTMDTGVMLSGSPTYEWHYDVAILSGEKSPGDTLATGQAERYGLAVNFRFMPGPVLVGASSNYYDHSRRTESRQATSLYGVISFGRWTNDRVPLALILEHVQARNWDSRLGNGFASSPSYVSALSSAESSGWLARFDYSLNLRWVLTYKYELLTPDRDFPADLYERHGLGFRWVIGPNTKILARTELSKATQPSESSRIGGAAQNSTYATLELGF